MDKKNLYSFIFVILIVGVLSFFGGIKYQEDKGGKLPNQQSGINTGGQQRSQFGQRRGSNNGIFRPTVEEIVGTDNTSITVKMQDGSTKIILITNKTTVNKVEQAAKSDLKTGERIAVFGQENSDGSVTAQTIQLNPQTGVMRNQ
ncbi:hypothetical protein HY041_01875 [Candidatus Roizmanbacteria bacterium]|nr:hypothetical protein [Candidatus Roizmanbacteria bacterium]